ncbi:hypothetical protein AYO20_02718 [Fonsecaea nubica]|uniref:PUM-HD domain-containing protein n=1 Tax=Fonsecaea nubica TaxID=856822 RepID=A0A178D9V4_9EURO|nr:hypothetical protein AYO20_02718 [Fonsecaea nubica]OAL37885.1 hypothetical protein AYO20_02718 [Fonsecaea nubica]
MATLVSTGSPTGKMSRKSTPTVKVREESDDSSAAVANTLTMATNSHSATSNRPSYTILHSDKLSNVQPPKAKDKTVSKPSEPNVMGGGGMEDILSRLKLNDSRKPTATPTGEVKSRKPDDFGNLDKLLNNLQDSSKALKKQEQELRSEMQSENHKGHPSSDDSFEAAKPTQHSAITSKVDVAEMMRVKQELEAARSVISRQEQELAETRTLKQTIDQAMGPPSEVDFGASTDISEQTIGHLQSAFNASARPFTSQTDAWASQDEHRNDFVRSRGIWNNPSTSMTNILATNPTAPAYNHPRDARLSGQAYNGVYGAPFSPAETNFQPRNFSGTGAPLGYDMRSNSDMMPINPTLSMRRNGGQLRINPSLADPMSQLSSFPPTATTLTPPPISPVGFPGQYNYQRGITTPITPATDFNTTGVQSAGNPWPLSAGGVNGQTYVTPLEPMNYRRLLDKSVSCDWKYIVDKIVCNNDQQASIFLQQKLKVGTAEQKFEIVEAIVNQAYPLMINRFGNFLVQRCFEHGTPDQVVAIANAIHGNVLSLSMDPFGCHVIQKAFDSVPEDHKADMVRELLRRIPDTVIHRYACHVWQKLFELRWSGEPPQIMLEVNKALRGMWHEVALGETGSLVVQNIFENCIEEEKRPAIEEVIANIDLIAHGQFGNWCIQHLCEHGSPPDKRRVIDHILANSYSYSIDQFASKVVEKCLKIGGPEFLDRYLGVITTAHPDRPRIPLIDIAGDQYGNYLIQWILMNTHHHQREQVAIHIRKHMVSLRGSKFGSRVAMLCCNPNSVTRPGPGAVVNPFGAPGQPRNQWPRFR